MNHYPKGGRCLACTRRDDRSCKHLPFHEMPVHRRDGVDVVVICTYFQRAPQESRQRG